MKKSIYTLIIATLATTILACVSGGNNWSKEQRKTIHRALHQYRDMVYLDELTDAEFYIFSDNVTDLVEYNYPYYSDVMAIPSLEDSIQVYVTTVIVEQLDADGANIRHIYPYRELKKENHVPSNLNRKEQRAFYKCLARKINTRYDSFSGFFDAVLADTTSTSEISRMEAECAKSLFDWQGAE